MIFYFDENSRELAELKEKSISWKPGMDSFFGYLLDSVQKLFAGVDAAFTGGGSRERTIRDIPRTQAQLLAYLGGHKPSKRALEY